MGKTIDKDIVESMSDQPLPAQEARHGNQETAMGQIFVYVY